MKNRLPKICRRADRNLAYVTLRGRKVYLGKYGSPESYAEYDRVIAEYLTGPVVETGPDCLLCEFASAFLARARDYYVKNGKSTKQTERFRAALAPFFVAPLDRLRVRDFGVVRLRAIQRDWENSGRYCRSYINTLVQCVRAAFKWGVAEGYVDPSVLVGLQAAPPLKRGRSAAREAPPVKPVAPETVDATLPFLPSVVAAMVRVQLLCGCRPGEICSMRLCDLETTGPVWVYRPESWKTQHLTRDADDGKRIPLGPKAQSILTPYLLERENSPTEPLFSPRDAWLERARERRAARKSPLTPSQRKRDAERRARLDERVRDRYDALSYTKAIKRAAEKAGVAPWTANQLRHLAATQIRAKFGLEAAQVVLGHANADTTQIYAERDFRKAAQIAAEIG
ncbi:MAG: site-specific integrase [Thermoguttaceae bacterium]|nr:site-specific integrase [Thermoguttaceae bacterium]